MADLQFLADSVEKLFGAGLHQSFGGIQTINPLTIVECRQF